MTKNCDVSSICNALIDILCEVTDEDIKSLGLKKGTMHLVDQPQQMKALELFKDHKYTVELGGSSLNTIRALSLLGKSTAFTGMIAQDKYGMMLTERMQELGIQSNLSITPNSGEATGTCLVLVTPEGERTMMTYLGASRLYTKKDLKPNIITNSKFFHFCGYQWDTAEQKAAIKEAIKIAKDSGVLVSFDVADPEVVRHNRNDFLDLIINYADIVFANSNEAQLLFEHLNYEKMLSTLTSYNTMGVIKLGEKGALVSDKKRSYPIAPVATKVVDTTGAGDIFAAGVLYGLTSGYQLKTAAEIGAILASDVICHIGANISKDITSTVLEDYANKTNIKTSTQYIF